ncbi:efflux RND transporter permease subunit [Sphingomonas ginkgonis]|uniref:Efflux RND transporter permease subunit n=1 Tax=Sphingomonas ginkgonis TaxID=2315330 RepID=A0A3R9WQK3_9SPHN|nr:efflux RND transporter permease subunit [Sphingomonas ginkgonis]RST31952.1 efflux RND transporter permease subunit [Sphingomonas ginkgonis]
MSFRNISSWCIKNPVPPIVFFIGLMLAGLLSFSWMSVTNNPDIDFPAAIVTISQPGAAPAEMETQVTQKVETAARSINGVDEINSSVREGNSQTFVQFQIGTPTDRAVNDLRDAVTQIRGDLPEGILEPQVSRVDVSGDPVVYVAAQTTDMTLEQLSWYLDDTVARRLRAVAGVASVSREGGVDRQIRVILNPAALQAQGITAAQVNAQLRAVNTNATGGRAEIAGSEQSVRVLGNAHSAYDLSQTDINVAGGRTVKLGDIANVEDSYSEQRTLAKLGGKQVVSFNIQRATGQSDLKVYDGVWEEMHKIEKENPRIHFSEISNNVDYTKSQYHSSIEALWEGAILAVFVVYLFLRDGRATAISALAIPLSAIPSFWFMSLLGLNLNFLSLLALSLVAGVLVDDAIVEIENIVRHMRMGKTAYQAAMDAADEIGLAVLATTMSIVAVFLPVALMPGISGQFFKSFGYTVVVSVLLSLFVARMITPLIAAYFLKSHGEQAHASGRLMDWYLGILRWTLDTRGAQASRERRPGAWGRTISIFRDHRVWMMGVGFLAFALTVLLIATLPMTFQPETNDNFSNVNVKMAPGSTLQQSEAVMDRAAGIIRADPDVDRVFERIYVGSGYLNIVLKADRKRTSSEFNRNIGPQLAAIPDAQVTVISPNSGGPGGGGRDIMLFLGSSDPALLSQAASKIAEEMGSLKEVRAPRVMGEQARPEITIKPHFDLAARLGVTTQALSQTIRIATLGDIEQNSAKFSLSDRQIPIMVSLSDLERRDLSTLENLPVPTTAGGSVPLKAVADIGFGSGPSTVQRTNQVRRLAIGADLTPGVVSGDAWKKINALPGMKNLPQGVSVLTLGNQKWQGELVKNFILALLSGVLLVFAVLVLLYRRFLAPFVNMGSLLLCPLGAALALHIAQQPLSMPVFIGLLMLFGIVAKNSILLIDFAVEMIEHGWERTAAILEAGHKRAQPIVMTTVAMVAGMVPVSLSLSGDGSWRAPMGITVMGGLLFSTLLTLLLVPAYFSLATDIEAWISRKFRKVLDNGEPHQPAQGPVLTPAE